MAKQQPQFVSRKEAATALGFTRQRLEKLIKQGRIPETQAGIDIVEAKRIRAAQTDPARKAGYEMARRRKLGPAAAPTVAKAVAAPPPPPGEAFDPAVYDFNIARSKRETHNAQMAELKFLAESGRLISREEVAAKEFEVARRIRDRILGFPARLASYLPPDAIHTITSECEALVRDLERDVATIAERSDPKAS